MEFLKNLKNKIFDDDDDNDGAGGAGGGGRDVRQRGGGGGREYDVVFGEGDSALGMTVAERDTNAGTRVVVVVRVKEGGAAQREGVREDDVILACEGSAVHSHENFVAISGAVRPLRLRFARAPQYIQGPRGGRVAASGGHTLGGGGSTAGGTMVVETEEEERRKRREEQRAAAQARSKAFEDKRTIKRRAPKLLPGGGVGAPSDDGGATTASGAAGESQAETKDGASGQNSIRTQQAVAAAKGQEAQLVQQLGYNPFEAQMTTHANARAAVVMSDANQPQQQLPQAPQQLGGPGVAAPVGGGGGAAFPAPGVVAPPAAAPALTPSQSSTSSASGAVLEPSEDAVAAWEALVGGDVVNELEEALATIASQATAPAPAGGDCPAVVAVQTAVKMLGNAISKPQEAKFRQIRIGNKGFQNRIAGVQGGMELFIAAGFTTVEKDGETFLQLAPADACLPVDTARLRLSHTRAQRLVAQLTAAR